MRLSLCPCGIPGGGGEGVVLPCTGPCISHVGVCAAPMGWVFVLFLSENRYRLCPFWSGIRYGFRWNYESL